MDPRALFHEACRDSSRRRDLGIRAVVLLVLLAMVGAALSSGEARAPGLTHLIPLYSLGALAGLIALGFSVWGFARFSPNSQLGFGRRKAALACLTVGSATGLNALIASLVMASGWSTHAMDAVGWASAAVTYLFLSAALFLLPARRSRTERASAWMVDVALIVISFSAFGWYFFVAPHIGRQAPSMRVWYELANPIVDLVAFAMVLGAITLGGPYRGSRGGVMVGILQRIVGDVLLAVAMFRHRVPPDALIHCFWCLSALTIGISALEVARPQEREKAPTSEQAAGGVMRCIRLTTPMFFLVAMAALACWCNWERPRSLATVGVDIAAGLGVLFSLFRISMLVRDNNRLTDELGRLNCHLDEQVRGRTSELRAATEDLDSQRHFLRSVIDALSSMVISTNSEGKVTLINEAARRYYGASGDAILGTPYLELVKYANPALEPEVLAEAHRILTGEPLIQVERQIRGADGVMRPFELVKTPVRNCEGEIVQLLTVGSDITLRKEAEKSLIEARDAAEQAAKVKSEFIATMSHEIRTPLNGIVGYVDYLEGLEVTPELREAAESIRSNANALLAIVDTILDLSRLSSSQLALHLEPTSMASFFEKNIEPFRAAAADKALRLRMDVHLDAEEQYLIDSARLGQIIDTLVSNAIKFTEEGTVSIDVDRLRVRRDVATIRVRISDTGIGIPAERLESVFDPFRQVDGSMSRRYGGMGLGLSLCRQLVTLLGGSIHVNSALGEGTQFVLELPLRLAHAESEAEASNPEELSGLHLLVVEDNPMNQKVIRRLLERLGCSVSIANNGLEAVQWLAINECDAVLMDWQMPVMDGLEATRMIRAFEAKSGEVPIIAVTANAMEGDRERCLAAGMDDYVAKPIRQEPLANAILRILALRKAA